MFFMWALNDREESNMTPRFVTVGERVMDWSSSEMATVPALAHWWVVPIRMASVLLPLSWRKQLLIQARMTFRHSLREETAMEGFGWVLM